jgi:hypothetical protein
MGIVGLETALIAKDLVPKGISKVREIKEKWDKRRELEEISPEKEVDIFGRAIQTLKKTPDYPGREDSILTFRRLRREANARIEKRENQK